MRVRALLLTLVIPAFGAGITACGQATRPAAAPQVRLELRSPADGTHVLRSSITVSGTVSPARAEVLVLGRPATVRPDGAFAARVPLSDGVNLIDVLASLPHASGAMSAIRVERYVLVTVPQVLGDSPSTATAALRAAGLVPKLQPASNPFSFLPLPDQVCAATPGPGARVGPGTTVTLDTSNLCGIGSAAAQTPPPPAATQKHDNGGGNGGIPGQGGDQGNSGNSGNSGSD